MSEINTGLTAYRPYHLSRRKSTKRNLTNSRVLPFCSLVAEWHHASLELRPLTDPGGRFPYPSAESLPLPFRKPLYKQILHVAAERGVRPTNTERFEKAVPAHAIKRYRGSEFMTPLINLGTKWKLVCSLTPRPFYLSQKSFYSRLTGSKAGLDVSQNRKISGVWRLCWRNPLPYQKASHTCLASLLAEGEPHVSS
jgi:hypothetical protein